MPPDTKRAFDRMDIWVPAAIGIAGLVYLLNVAASNPAPTPFQLHIYVTVLALASAAFGVLIPGLLRVNIEASGLAIRAAGALAIFCAGSSLKIVSIAPDPSEPLHVGEKVQIRIDIDYVLKDPSGWVQFYVQNDGKPLIAGNHQVLVGAETGPAHFETDIEVPQTTSVEFFAALFAGDPREGGPGGTTHATGSRRYRVVGP